MKLLAPRLSRHSWSDVEAPRPPGEPPGAQGAGQNRVMHFLVAKFALQNLLTPKAASAPPHRSKSAGRVVRRLIPSPGIVFWLRNHCPVLPSRLERPRWPFPRFQDLRFFFGHFEPSESPASKPDSIIATLCVRNIYLITGTFISPSISGILA